MSFLSKSYQIVLDRAGDTTVNGKDLVDGFNAVQKQYLDTCLRMCSTPEVDKIDSKLMYVDSVTKKGEVSFSEEEKRLVDLSDEIGTKVDKKHAKHETKARLKHKYYWVHKEEDIVVNGMKDFHKILNNQDKVTMKHFYNIRCNPDLYKGLCAMRQIPCTCNGCVEQLIKHWSPNLDKTLQPRYVIKPGTCKYFSILRGYNKWYICQIDLIKRNNKPGHDGY